MGSFSSKSNADANFAASKAFCAVLIHPAAETKSVVYLTGASTKKHWDECVAANTSGFTHLVDGGNTSIWIEGWADGKALGAHLGSAGTADHVKWVTESKMTFDLATGAAVEGLTHFNQPSAAQIHQVVICKFADAAGLEKYVTDKSAAGALHHFEAAKAIGGNNYTVVFKNVDAEKKVFEAVWIEGWSSAEALEKHMKHADTAAHVKWLSEELKGTFKLGSGPSAADAAYLNAKAFCAVLVYPAEKTTSAVYCADASTKEHLKDCLAANTTGFVHLAAGTSSMWLEGWAEGKAMGEHLGSAGTAAHIKWLTDNKMTFDLATGAVAEGLAYFNHPSAAQVFQVVICKFVDAATLEKYVTDKTNAANSFHHLDAARTIGGNNFTVVFKNVDAEKKVFEAAWIEGWSSTEALEKHMKHADTAAHIKWLSEELKGTFKYASGPSSA